MKKAKMILATIALLAVIGGAVAFKTSRYYTGDPAFRYSSTTRLTALIEGKLYSTTISVCEVIPNRWFGGNQVSNVSSTLLKPVTYFSGASTVIFNTVVCEPTATFVTTVD